MLHFFKKINPKLISSAVLLIITGALLLTCTFTFAWFADNHRVQASGMQISANDKRITISDMIEVTRTLGGKVTVQTYRCEEHEDYYYLYENDSFTTDENGDRIPFSISDLLPGEIVEVTFSYTCSDNLIGSPISAKLTSISSDSFPEIDHPDVSHYVLGVYKFSSKQGGEYPAGTWMVNYVSGQTEAIPESLPVFTDTIWNKVSDVPQDNYVTASFRFEFDLEQYTTLKTTTNLLSEKRFSIGELRIEVAEHE